MQVNNMHFNEKQYLFKMFIVIRIFNKELKTTINNILNITISIYLNHH